jgi:hypothetical protein
MSKFKEGDRVRIIGEAKTLEGKLAKEAHKEAPRLYPHMIGCVGTVANFYNEHEVAVDVDLDSLAAIPREVHQMATDRMRAQFQGSVNEETRKALTEEEMKFTPHYVLLVAAENLEKV